jgi:hypothetical protein
MVGRVLERGGWRKVDQDAKLQPDIVTDPSPVRPMFQRLAKLTIGAACHHTRATDAAHNCTHRLGLRRSGTIEAE